MRHLWFLLLISIVLTAPVFAYDDLLDFGTHSSGLAESDIAMPSPGMSITANPAFFFPEQRLSTSFHYCNHYGIAGLNSNLANIRYSSRGFGLGFEYAGFGSSGKYMESEFALAAGGRIYRRFQLGLALKLLQLDIGEYKGYARQTSINLATGYCGETFGAAAVVSDLRLSAKNIGEDELEKLYLVAISYRIEKLTGLHLCYAVRGPNRWVSIGQSIDLSRMVSVQLGIKSDPVVPAFGLSIGKDYFEIEYSYRYHSVLGGTHRAGLVINYNP
jgi:hypothetical protein